MPKIQISMCCLSGNPQQLYQEYPMKRLRTWKKRIFSFWLIVTVLSRKNEVDLTARWMMWTE